MYIQKHLSSTNECNHLSEFLLVEALVVTYLSACFEPTRLYENSIVPELHSICYI